MSINKKSTLTWSDALYLHRKLAEVQESLMQYASHGCPEYGLQNDFFVHVQLHELGKVLEDIRNKG